MSPFQNRDVAVTGDDGELAELDTASYASGPGRVALSVIAE